MTAVFDQYGTHRESERVDGQCTPSEIFGMDIKYRFNGLYTEMDTPKTSSFGFYLNDDPFIWVFSDWHRYLSEIIRHHDVESCTIMLLLFSIKSTPDYFDHYLLLDTSDEIV